MSYHATHLARPPSPTLPPDIISSTITTTTSRFSPDPSTEPTPSVTSRSTTRSRKLGAPGSNSGELSITEKIIALQRKHTDRVERASTGERRPPLSYLTHTRQNPTPSTSSNPPPPIPLYRPLSGTTSASRRTRDDWSEKSASAGGTGGGGGGGGGGGRSKTGRSLSGFTSASGSTGGGLIPHSEWEENQAAAHAALGVDVDEWRAGKRVGGDGGGGGGSETRNGERGNGSRRRVRYAEEEAFDEDEDEDDDFDRERGVIKDPGRGTRTRSHGSGVLFDDGRSNTGSGLLDDARSRGARSQGSGRREPSVERDRRTDRSLGSAKMDAYDDDGGSGGQVPNPRFSMTTSTGGQDQGTSRPIRASANNFNRGTTRPMSSTAGLTSSTTQQPLPARKLFDPHIHDPVRFAQAPSQSTGGSTSRTGSSSALLGGYSSYPGVITARKGSSLATTVSLEPSLREREKGEPRDRGGANGGGGGGGGSGRRPINDDEEGDRERERRRRKDGSERGSQNQGRHRRDEDGRSRGSRSSEGSESLKDRERGRGKSDTGIMFRLREAYKVIQALEHKLTDMHRKMSADPSAGVRVLINAGLLGQGLHTTPSANIAGTGGSGQSFNPVQSNGAVGVIRQAMDDEEDEYSRGPIAPRQPKALPAEVIEDEAWVELVALHKQLAHAHHDFLALSMDPLIPASMHSLPIRYNIPTRLWQTAFHLILERMRYTWIANAPSAQTGGSRMTFRDNKTSAKVLDHLTDFIYDAYSFYTSLLEERTLSSSTFRAAWIEALGDLARYRMAVAGHIAALEKQTAKAKPVVTPVPVRMGRIDDEDEPETEIFPSGASIGVEVAESWDVEDRETWRITARDWYVMGLGEKPGEGRLHHHLALLCRDVKGEEGRALYHFVKSLTASHPYATTRESILPLFDTALQRKRATPDATAADLFLLLHGMIFTRIELDEFDSVFDRYMERLEEDMRTGLGGTPSARRRPIPQVEWLMMGVVNLSAILQYGSDDSFLRKAAAEDPAARKVTRAAPPAQPQAIMVHQTTAEHMAEDGQVATTSGDEKPDAGLGSILRKLAISPSLDLNDPETFPPPFRNALRLAFTVFEFCLKHPTRQAGFTTVLNPYITVFLTFLSTVLKQWPALGLLERFIPWHALAEFFNTIPRKIEVGPNVSPKLMGGPPIPEDWCLRGMDWVGRRVYERGFWKQKSGHSGGNSGRGSSGPAQPRSGPRIQSEMDVLLADHDVTQADAADGLVDDGEGADTTDAPAAITQRRWRRVAWSAGILSSCVPGFSFDSPISRRIGINIGGPLDRKINQWEDEYQQRMQMEAESRRKEEEARGEWADTVDEIEAVTLSDEETEDDGGDPELRELRAKRRYLRNLLDPSRAVVSKPHTTVATKRVAPAKRPFAKAQVLPGYTVLVFDTNVLLSSLEMFARVADSGRWTVVVPLPVVTELDGLAKNPAPLGPAAATAIAYLESHIRSTALTLKVQTSKGNYLSDLLIRAENFSDSSRSDVDQDTARAHTMDDFILRVASFQVTHFIDRSNALGMSDQPGFEEKKKTAPKVLLLTFDRNLRLRARARGVDAADEKEMAKILGSGG